MSSSTKKLSQTKDKSEIQAVLFFKPKWTVAKSKAWLKQFNLVPLKGPDTTLFKNQIRYRITDPKQYKRYTSKLLVNNKGFDTNVHLILGWK